MQHPLPVNEYVDLSPLIRVSDFASLHEDICLALLSAEVTYANSGIPLAGSVKDTKGFWEASWREECSKKLSSDIAAKFKAMPAKDQRKFAALHGGLFTMMAAMVVNQGSHENRGGSGNLPHPTNYKLFTNLVSWIDAQDIFEQTGRIVIFLNPPGFPQGLHRDSPESLPIVEEFLWFCPAKNKRIVLYEEGTTVVAQSSAVWFNSNQLHGSTESLGHSYSIRVDGKFNPRARAFLRARVGGDYFK
jgi:hypothetical protein